MIRLLTKLSVLRFSVGVFTAFIALWGCTSKTNDPIPTVKILEPANNSTVTGPNIKLKLALTDWKFALLSDHVHTGSADPGALFKVAHSEATAGHVHVYLDKVSDLDADAVANLDEADSTILTGVNAGKHFIIVQGASADHEDIEGMRDSVSFLVQ